MVDLKKSLRLQKLYDILKTREHYLTAATLAERLHVSERTVYRDLRDLGVLGCEVYSDRGYKIRSGSLSLRIEPTGEDIFTLMQLVDSSPLTQAADFREKCQSLLAKLQCFCADAEPDSTAVVRYSDATPLDGLLFDMRTLEDACLHDRVCILTYQALDEPHPVERTVYPYCVTIRIGQWYLIALDEAQNDFRIYRFERIRGLKTLDRTFERDPAFDIETFFENSWAVFRGPETTVRVRLRGVAARIAAERMWPKSMRFEWAVPGEEVVLTVTVRGDQEILNWVLGMGDLAEILDPPDLREKACQILSAALRQYTR